MIGVYPTPPPEGCSAIEYVPLDSSTSGYAFKAELALTRWRDKVAGKISDALHDLIG